VCGEDLVEPLACVTTLGSNKCIPRLWTKDLRGYSTYEGRFDRWSELKKYAVQQSNNFKTYQSTVVQPAHFQYKVHSFATLQLPV
jgi:hypothetical protein